MHFLAISSLHQVAHAQQYHFIDYSLEEGLPHSQVESVFQDRDGYLWIGTLGGASRFDGRTFTNYSEQNALLSNQINDIAQDSKGNIWLATIGGLTMFDGTAFISFPFADSLSGENVKDIAIDGFDNIWMAMGAKGLGMFDRHTYLFRSLPEEMRDQYVRTIVLKSDGIWLGTKMGIVKLEGKQFKQLNIEDFKDINVSRICVAENGSVWIATYGSGVFSLSGNKVEHYDATSGLISDWIRNMVQDGHGNFWFASKYGVCKLDVSGSRIMHFSQKNGLKHSNINVLTLDNEGNIWLGSDGGGVIKFAGEEFEHFTADEGLGNGIVMSEVEDNEGNMWFSTYGSGLCRFDGEHFKCYTAIDGLANNTVWTSDKDHKGVLWFGTSEGITSCRNGHFESYSIAEGLIGKKVISLYCDNNGRIWYGTKEGVAVLKHTNGKWSGKSGSGIRKIGHNVRAILQSDDGAMWFGTSEGLYKLLKGKLSHFTEKDGLGNNTVYSICADGRGNLWLGTKGGIVFYNRESDRFNIIGFNDESRSEFINFTIIDRNQTLWSGTNNGIFTIDLEKFYNEDTLITRHYTTHDGVVSPECNLNAAYEDSRGYLWFGTSEGLVRYISTEHGTGRIPVRPYINITGIRLNLENVDWHAYSRSIKTAGNLPLNLQLKYRDNHLTFDFTGISLSNPEQVRYKFKLEGFDEKWSPLTSAAFATYSNLPFGQYKFLVKSRNMDGYWSSAPAEFSFEILPPFWRTWLFYCIMAFLLASIVLVLYRWRLAVAGRKENIRQLEFKSRLLALEHQTLNASMNRHFVFNALNSIQYYINKQDKLLANKYLSSFAKLIRKNLDSSQGNESALSEEIERLQLYLALEGMRFKDRFEYEISVDEALDLDGIMVPSMLLQPYVENSIAHGILPMKRMGKVTIEVSADTASNHLIFRITDDGIGIERSRNAKIKNLGDHVSKGMDITRRRIELLREMKQDPHIQVKGPNEISDENGVVQGTCVEIILPLNGN